MVYLFKRKFPKRDDLVIARIEAIHPNVIDVVLPEYNNISGLITYSELSRKKKQRDIDKILIIGKESVMLVMNSDQDSGTIDLSKRDVKDTEVEDYMNRMRLHKILYNLFKYILLKLKGIDDIEKITEEELYPYLTDSLFEIQEESGLENQEIYNKLLNKEENSQILDFIDYENIYYKKEDFKEVLDHYIDTKINIKKDSETTNFRMLTYGVNGLDDIKYTLDFENFTIYENISKYFDIEITYISASNYSMVLNQKEVGLGNIKESIGQLVEEIAKRAREKNIILG